MGTFVRKTWASQDPDQEFGKPDVACDERCHLESEERRINVENSYETYQTLATKRRPK